VVVVTNASNWFGEIFSVVAAAFAAAWTWVSSLFASIWEGIKGVVMGFVEWLSPVIDMIIAPFKAIGTVIGGIIGSVKGWLGETVEIGENELARMNENKMRDAAAKQVQAAAPAPQTAMTPLMAPSTASTPVIAAPATPVPGIEIGSPIAAPVPVMAPSTVSTPVIAGSTTTASSSGNSLAMEHLAAAQRKGVSASAMSYAASSAFQNAGAYIPPITPVATLPQPAMPGTNNAFLESLPGTMAVQSPIVTQNLHEDIDKQLEVLVPRTSEKTVVQERMQEQVAKGGNQSIHIDKLYLQAEDCEVLLDFARMIMQSVYQEALV
jgi:hypothetical protein